MTGEEGLDAVRSEYDMLRRGVGAHRTGRDALSVHGPDAGEYLQGQCSQDLAALAVGGSADSLVLSPQGKIDALVRVTCRADDDYVVDVDAGYGGALAARLERFRLRVKVEIGPLDWSCLALRGPGAVAAASAAASDAAMAVPFSWGTVVGVDLLGPDPVLPPGVAWCGVDAWEALRVESGIPRMGAEIDEQTIAAEADLVDRCVSFTKGCYTGQELVARLDARGNRVARRLCGLVVDMPGTGRAALASARTLPGAEVVVDGKAVGAVTSAAWSPALDRVVALAYVHRSVPSPAGVGLHVLGAADGAPEVPAWAEVRALPLV